MKAAKEKSIGEGKNQLSDYDYIEFERRYNKIINQAYEANPLPTETGVKKCGRKKRQNSLADRAA